MKRFAGQGESLHAYENKVYSLLNLMPMCIGSLAVMFALMLQFKTESWTGMVRQLNNFHDGHFQIMRSELRRYLYDMLCC